MSWDPIRARDWANALGLAPASYFAALRADKPDGDAKVLLDGQASSLAWFATEDRDRLLNGDDPLSWTWSSHLRRAFVIDTRKMEIYLRTWGENGDRKRLKMPRSASEAEQLFKDASNAPRPRAASVITQLLTAFKALRAVLVSYNAANVDIIRAFNLLIESADYRDELESCSNLSDIARLLDRDEDLKNYGGASVQDSVYILLNSTPPGVPLFDADLLVRHASGTLYQEAHFELERQTMLQMSIFGGLTPTRSTRGHMPRDARFTPTPLARTLAEQCLEDVPGDGELVILDPACGCGVFLLEALRELEAKSVLRQIRLIGFDMSEVSEEIAKFCLGKAVCDANESGMNVTYEIRRCDALAENWGEPTVILMNPPFASVNDMTADERDVVRNILGSAGHGKIDKSMAFMFKAADCLATRGQMASVLPSTLFDSTSGEKWRDEMMNRIRLRLLGRFRGYEYFQGALVEPGFVVGGKRGDGHTPDALTVLVADQGAEDEALRSLRKGHRQVTAPEQGVHLSFDYSSDAISPAAWMPRTFAHESLLAALSNTPIVESLFDVMQGAHTGANDVFILSDDELMSLPLPERAFFKPAAGTKTIRNGQLLRGGYVFFPYGEQGLRLQTLDELTTAVPEFYERALKPNEDRLARRPSLVERNAQEWWILNRERQWHLRDQPKILSGYFGVAGAFAYDSLGEFVCVHGYTWFPRDEILELLNESDIDFYTSDLPWAYVGILNSKPFELLLSCFCSRVQGGQYNLSKRFVSNVPLPDLFREEVPGDLVAELAEAGKCMGRGMTVNDSWLTPLVSRAYGVPISKWQLEDQK